MPGLGEMFRQLGILALLSIAVSISVFVVAISYAIKPTERKLLIMRPMSLAALFAGISGFLAGWAFMLRGMAFTAPGQGPTPAMYMGGAENFAMGFACFGFLAAAWMMVAIGMARRS